MLFASPVLADSSSVNFNRDVLPILSENCFACHGPSESAREADLRFDIREGATADLGGYQALVPGDSSSSVMIERITSDEEWEIMPPADSGKKLTAAQVDLLKRWIDQGAPYAKHWSFLPAQRPRVPTVNNTDWARNPIDHFVQQQHESNDLAPSPEADRRTLIRRLYFDLVGLPPSREEVDAFERDTDPNSYQRAVERLLESPHYGEQLATYWLDLVRYADTVGYHGDQPMPVAAYRDYVIQAFNNDLSFEQFTREQLAGDLLENPTPWQKIATAYNRLNQKTAEGGAQDKEYLAIYQADRIRNVSEVWLGLTMGCCQCHDHKYDPLTSRDFYSFGAFFADIKQKGFYANAHATAGWGTSMRVPDPALITQLSAIDEQIAKVKADIEAVGSELGNAQKAWEARMVGQIKSAGEPRDQVWIDDQQLPNGERSGTWDFVGNDVVPIHSGKQARRQKGEGTVQHFVLGAKDVLQLEKDAVLYAFVYLDPSNPPDQIMLQFNDGTWEHRAYWGQGGIPFGADGSPSKRSMGDLPPLGKWVRLEVPIDQVGLGPGAKINGMAFTQWNGTAYWDQAGVRQSHLPLTAELREILSKPSSTRTADEATRLAVHFRSTAPELAPLQKSLSDLTAKRQALEDSARRCLITVPTDPMTVRILPRGNWLDESGEVVQPAIPQVLGDLDSRGERGTRLDLANWMVSGSNPLTARVFVNRLWYRFFGRGITNTLDDFGTQGEYPTHPELLDWLATEFVDSGWSVKHMVRLMVTSSTYRQSSYADAEARNRDPFNKLLARQGRFRLPAEVIRDNALSVGGLLVEEVGGDSVKPYQPAGYWQHLNFPKRTYEPSQGNALWRRSLYTHWQRTFLHPSLRAFDAPSREECTVKRPRSNTPLQALVLLNDPIFVEAARGLAERLIREGGSSDDGRIRYGCQLVLQREPTKLELNTLLDFATQQRALYAKDVNAAQALLSVGESPLSSNLDPEEVAAATAVARVLLNLHETITRY
jgi:hypothetical protein